VFSVIIYPLKFANVKRQTKIMSKSQLRAHTPVTRIITVTHFKIRDCILHINIKRSPSVTSYIRNDYAEQSKTYVTYHTKFIYLRPI